MNIHLLEVFTQPKRPGNIPTIMRQRHSSFKTLGRTNTQAPNQHQCHSSVLQINSRASSDNNSASDKVLSHIASKRDVHCWLSVHVTCTARLICSFPLHVHIPPQWRMASGKHLVSGAVSSNKTPLCSYIWISVRISFANFAIIAGADLWTLNLDLRPLAPSFSASLSPRTRWCT